MIYLIDLFDINNLESQCIDKLQINKLTLASSSQDRKKARIEELYPRKNWYPKPTPLIYNLKKDILMLIRLIRQI